MLPTVASPASDSPTAAPTAASPTVAAHTVAAPTVAAPTDAAPMAVGLTRLRGHLVRGGYDANDGSSHGTEGAAEVHGRVQGQRGAARTPRGHVDIPGRARPRPAPSALGEWVARARADAGTGSPGSLATTEREELARLRKANRVLREER